VTSSRLNTTGSVRGTCTGFIFDINSLRSYAVRLVGAHT
jgi:hypothetical protein